MDDKDYWGDDGDYPPDYDYPEDPNPDPGIAVDDPPPPPDDPVFQEDGADENGIVWQNGEVVGMDLGDGTWVNLDGEMFDANGNSLGSYFTGQSFDELAGGITPSDDGNGFLSGLGNFFRNLFGGSGGGGSPGGGGSMGGATGQMASRAQQAAQNLQRAREQGASPQTIQALQRQLYMTQQALARMHGGSGSGGLPSGLLLAGAVGLGVYFLAKRRE